LAARRKKKLNRNLDKIPRPGEKYLVEIYFEIFETDIPAQHMWSPQSGKYKVLWTPERLNRALINSRDAGMTEQGYRGNCS